MIRDAVDGKEKTYFEDHNLNHGYLNTIEHDYIDPKVNQRSAYTPFHVVLIH